MKIVKGIFPPHEFQDKMNITGYISIYAALLSTAIFIWNISNSRPKIAVTLTLGLGGPDNQMESGVYLVIRNPSTHTVHINGVSLLYPFRDISVGEKIVHVLKYRKFSKYIGWVHVTHIFDSLETRLPVSIEPRNSHSIFIPNDSIKKMFGENDVTVFAASAQDAL